MFYLWQQSDLDSLLIVEHVFFQYHMRNMEGFISLKYGKSATWRGFHLSFLELSVLNASPSHQKSRLSDSTRSKFPTCRLVLLQTLPPKNERQCLGLNPQTWARLESHEIDALYHSTITALHEIDYIVSKLNQKVQIQMWEIKKWSKMVEFNQKDQKSQ